MTWSVATPMWVTPLESMPATDQTTATRRPHLLALARCARRPSEELAEQLVGAVDKVAFTLRACHARKPQS